jgi:phosphate transport system substrate-binding protein
MMRFDRIRRRWLIVGLAALAVASVAFAACGDDDDKPTPTPTTPAATATTPAATATTPAATATTPAATATTPAATRTPGINYGSLTGSVLVDGSSTVFPITEAVAEEFSKVARNVRATVGFSGTGGGGEKFCRGEIDIWNASRPATTAEKERCAAAGITDMVEIQVAIDALTVVTNKANNWAVCLKTAEIQKLFQDGGATKWSDIRPEWPADNIKFYYPGADSGTFDYFLEAIKLRGPSRNEPSHRSDGTASEDDNILVRGVEGDKNAIGYFGFAYYIEEKARMNAVKVDGGEGCVEPTFENALAGKYKPLSRPLFIYVREATLKEKPQVLGFVNFYIDNMQKLAADVGYVSLPDDKKAEQAKKIEKFLPTR